MTDDPTARLASNTPLPVEDKRLMDQGIADKVRLICHVRKTPNVLYAIFVNLARQFYSSRDNLPIDICPVWDPDVNKTGIWINTELQWEDEATEFRPAIYVKLGEISYSSLTGRHDGRMHLDLEQGEYWFSRSGKGIVTWMHIGSNSNEAAALAGATLDYMDGLSWVIKNDFNFTTFEITSMGPTTIEKESTERFKSPVIATFTFQDTWSLKLESPKLKRIVLQARQDAALHVIL